MLNVFRVPFFVHHPIFFAIVYPKFPPTCHIILTFFVGQLNWWFTLVLYYHYINIQWFNPENGMKPEALHPAKKVVKSSSKCLFWGSKSRFSQRGVTVFQPCMLMLKGFLWLMVQVSEMFLSHDIQMRQARPWRPRHRPCLWQHGPPRRFIWKFCFWTS